MNPSRDFLKSSPMTSWRLAKRLVDQFAKGYWPYMLAGFLCMLVTAGSTAALAKMLEPIFDDVFIKHDAVMLKWVAGATLMLFAGKGLATYGEAVNLSYVSQRMIADIRDKLFGHLLTLDLSYFHNIPSGELISRLNNDVALLNAAVTDTLTGMGKDALTLVFLIALMFYQDWMLASIAFFVFPIAILPILKIGRRMRKTSLNIQQEMAEYTVLLGEVFQGARVVKSYVTEAYERGRAKILAEKIFELTFKSTRVKSRAHPMMEMLGGIAIVVVIIYGGSQVIAGNRSTGAFMSFITALMFVYEPLKRLANLNSSLQEKLAAADRVFATLDTPATIKDALGAVDLQVKQGGIRFKDVSFTYPNVTKPTLDRISLDIPSGKTIALVGASGAGKSTLLNLIPRFYDAQSGQLTIDGIDIQHLTIQSLRSQIALVSQEIMLFNDTVRANIAYGKGGYAEESEIIKAAVAAGADGFISKLPQGYDTIVGELGVRLSGGQRQRLAIARAMLKNAPILLLDEATSALDTESERHVQKALQTLMKGRTTLIIAHRLSTVMKADCIHVMEDGRVIESGAHQQLLDLEGRYASLCKAQFEEAA